MKEQKTDLHLSEIKGCIDRVFSTEDGKYLMEFLENMAGYEMPIPRCRLEMQEGARRLVIMLKQIQKCKPANMRIMLTKLEGMMQT